MNAYKNYSQEFLQCVSYIFFRYQLKKSLEEKSNNYIYSNNNIIWNKNDYYLISYNWIQKWRNYIGFSIINEKMKKFNKQYIEEKDYSWVKKIIDESKKFSNLEPLKNRDIYIIERNNNIFKIEMMKKFVICDKVTFNLFINKNDPYENDINKHPSVKAKFLYNKMIIKIDEYNYFVSFKSPKNKYHEICFNINKNKDNPYLNSLLDDLIHYDINYWITLNGFNIDTPYFIISYGNSSFTIINKTFILNEENGNVSLIRPGLFQPDIIKEFHDSIKKDLDITNNLMSMFNNITTKRQDFNSTTIIQKNLHNNYFNNNSIFPHKMGLQNIGQTCYMNATLQCLSNIEPLTKYIFSINFMMIRNPLGKPLTIFYYDLLQNLFYPTPEIKFQGYYAPYNFKQIIGKMNPLFQGFHPADSKDLLFFILETLHEELNIVNKYNIFNNNNNFNLGINLNDENAVFNQFMKDFNSKNNSIITNLFYGVYKSYLKCLNCNKKTYSFQTFNIIIIPLINAYKYKNKKYGYMNNNALNIYDAFESMNMGQNFEGENKIYCNSCQTLCNAYHQQVIFITPKILIIVLNRGKNNLDYQGEFEFYSELDLTKIMCNNNNNVIKKYFLIGVITHLGESGSSGHFIAYCRNKQRDFFHCYNDASVCQLNKNDNAYGKNQSNNIYEKKTPYILFYQCI